MLLLLLLGLLLLLLLGQAEGAMDAANLLKPMLARGELRTIGATTLAEYRQHIEKDAAFERRFQQVTLIYLPGMDLFVDVGCLRTCSTIQ
jgi:ATP-dependent Clp protease ATP-binding subunit ClpB